MAEKQQSKKRKAEEALNGAKGKQAKEAAGGAVPQSAPTDAPAQAPVAAAAAAAKVPQPWEITGPNPTNYRPRGNPNAYLYSKENYFRKIDLSKLEVSLGEESVNGVKTTFARLSYNGKNGLTVIPPFSDVSDGLLGPNGIGDALGTGLAKAHFEGKYKPSKTDKLTHKYSLTRTALPMKHEKFPVVAMTVHGVSTPVEMDQETVAWYQFLNEFNKAVARAYLKCYLENKDAPEHKGHFPVIGELIESAEKSVPPCDVKATDEADVLEKKLAEYAAAVEEAQLLAIRGIVKGLPFLTKKGEQSLMQIPSFSNRFSKKTVEKPVEVEKDPAKAKVLEQLAKMKAASSGPKGSKKEVDLQMWEAAIGLNPLTLKDKVECGIWRPVTVTTENGVEVRKPPLTPEIESNSERMDIYMGRGDVVLRSEFKKPKAFKAIPFMDVNNTVYEQKRLGQGTIASPEIQLRMNSKGSLTQDLLCVTIWGPIKEPVIGGHLESVNTAQVEQEDPELAELRARSIEMTKASASVKPKMIAAGPSAGLLALPAPASDAAGSSGAPPS